MAKIRSYTRRLLARDIAREIHQMIAEQGLQPGDVLPSLRKLSTTYRVSHETIRRAYKILDDHQIVTSKQGLGVIVKENYKGNVSSLSFEETGSSPARAKLQNVKMLKIATPEHSDDKKPFWNDVIKAFQKLYPDIDIHIQPTPGRHNEDESTPYDIIHSNRTELTDHSRKGALMNLSSFINDNPVFDKPLLANLSYDKSPVCFYIPIAVDSYIMYINKQDMPEELFGELEANWNLEGILRVASKLAQNKKLKKILPIHLPRPTSFIRYLGFDNLDPKHFKNKFSGLPDFLDDAKKVFDIYPHYHIAVNYAYAQLSYESFKSRQVLMNVHHTFALADMLKNTKFRWSVKPIPMASKFTSDVVYQCLGVSRNSKYPDECIDFLSFMAGEQGQNLIAKHRNNLPVDQAITLGDSFIQGKPEGLSEIVTYLKRTREIGNIAYGTFFLTYMSAWEREIHNFLLGNQDAKSTAEILREKSYKYVDAYQVEL